jgi:hypothetical protein
MFREEYIEMMNITNKEYRLKKKYKIFYNLHDPIWDDKNFREKGFYFHIYCEFEERIRNRIKILFQNLKNKLDFYKKDYILLVK